MKEFMKMIGSSLVAVVVTVWAATWGAALILAGPALLKLCISYLFF